jgi:hypothetical protein
MLLDAEVPIIALEPHGRPLEELYLRIVRGTPDETTPEADHPPPGRPGTGDTLLRELLRGEDRREPDAEG